MRVRRLAALALLVAAPATASDQFDLVCKGRVRFSVTDQYEPHASRLRLDLKAKRFCESECTVTHPIADVQPNYIMFQQASDEEKAVGTIYFYQVDRATGKLTQFKSAKRPYHSWIEHDAVCEAAPFSGFPQLPTKF